MVLGLLVSALLGCSRSPAASSTTPIASSPVPSASPSPSPSPAPNPVQAAKWQPVTPTPADVAAFERHLGAGRAATQRHDYEAAVRSFDAALTAIPNHPRALAERGYARLLAKELDLAEGDFQRAQAVERDANLDAQIWFNIGLVREQRGDRDGARTAFERSSVLNPTKAARGKLGESSTCIAQITEREALPARTKDEIWDPTVMRVASWSELYDVFARTFGKAGRSFRSDEDARNALCDQECSGKAPVVLSQFSGQNLFVQYVWEEPKGLFVHHSGVTGHVVWGKPCVADASPSAREVRRRGDTVEVLVRSEAVSATCAEQQMSQDGTQDGDGAACKPCPPTALLETRTYYDVASATHLVTVFQRYSPKARAAPVSSEIEGNELVLKGGSCDRRIDLAALAKRPVRPRP